MSTQPSVAVVYASVHHGNTRKLAEAFAEQFSADLIPVEDAMKVQMEAYDLVGIGSGIYFGRHHKSLRILIDSWKDPPRSAFIFSTAGLPFLQFFQHSSLRRRLVGKGCRVIGEFCCRGWDTVGPLWLMGGINRKHPSTRDLERSVQFARRLKVMISLQRDHPTE